MLGLERRASAAWAGGTDDEAALRSVGWIGVLWSVLQRVFLRQRVWDARLRVAGPAPPRVACAVTAAQVLAQLAEMADDDHARLLLDGRNDESVQRILRAHLHAAAANR